ncbi:hypothetical protein MLD38_006458 [Melastoma candidum]|uniref:Uncharacterized protein n=1 Tax=Melastoma candidum TaxID=119954 RepID=A0ACB9RP74_9MYRT|nr:hypothetical protein MLD38_006458 [Melastoma candidum]
MENEGLNGWIRDGLYYHPHLFGGVILTAALVGLSTSYFGGIKVPSLHYFGSEIFPKRRHARRRVRVYMDGCFDLMHYGHANALRQAKALGDELVVGVVSNEEIVANKGPPVLSMEERMALVSGLKWVDEVIPNAPYAITEDFMKLLFCEYKIDYIIHGDDPCLLPDGSDAYALAKKAGRYKQIKRTEGVSSTDIVGRILSYSKDTLENGNTNDSCINNVCQSQAESTHISQFLPTSRRIVQFSNGKSPAPNSRIVYIDGAFDLFHAGHVEILKKARELGDFLLVGIYSDQTVSEHRGRGHPIMHLHERSLSVLACRYVDEIIIGAPWAITKDMITTFNITLVVHGTIAERASRPGRSEADPYAVPKSMGIFQLLKSPKDMTTSIIAQRIAANHEAYIKRNAKKTESEKKYYAEKKYVVDE